MRTTISIDDGLLADAKRKATAKGLSLSRYIQQALRAWLAVEETGSSPPPFELVTFGGGGPRPGIDLDRTSALLEDDDLDRFATGSRDHDTS